MQLAQTLVSPPAPTLHSTGRYGDVGLTGLEIASGQILDAGEPVALGPPAAEPLAELERSLVNALLRPPCVVAFSGGRDSTALLALAASVARREGLEPPVAVTQRFPEVPEAQEDDWQEHMIADLGIGDWIRIEQQGSDLDVIGPLARQVLERHGSIYPPNAHFLLPMLEHARGGTLITGLDGDMIFGSWRWHALGKVLARRTRAQARDVLRVGHYLAPAPVQRAMLRHRPDPRPVPPWLRETARPAYLERRVHNLKLQTRRFDRFVPWLAGTRHVRSMRRQLDLIANPAGVTMLHPFLEPGFLSAYAAWGGALGRGTRTDVMCALFGDVLPDEVLTRSSKAHFEPVYHAAHTRAFAAEWDGSGLDPELVDAEVLRAEIDRPDPNPCSGLLVQWLWCRTHRAAA